MKQNYLMRINLSKKDRCQKMDVVLKNFILMLAGEVNYGIHLFKLLLLR